MSRIVLADDEPHVRCRLRDALEAAGHTVRLAANGTEALDLIREEAPDLAVIDVMMPFVDGYEVLARLRQAPATRELPVIVLTARSPDASLFHAWECAVWKEDADHLTKPFEPDRLLAKIEWLARTGRHAPLVLFVGTPQPSWDRIGMSLSDAGLRVYVARHRQSAGEWIHKLKPDLVIVDRITTGLEATLAATPGPLAITPAGALLHPADAASCGAEDEALLRMVTGLQREIRP